MAKNSIKLEPIDKLNTTLMQHKENIALMRATIAVNKKGIKLQKLHMKKARITYKTEVM